MIFEQLNAHACRTYLIGDAKNQEAVLVDPVLEGVDEYLRILEQKKLRLTHVIDTHTHADHLSGGAALKDRTGCEYVMHVKAPARCVTFHVTDGFECRLGNVPVKVMATPGHTKDSLTLVLPDRVLTGDVLFLDDAGAGRTDLPGGDAGEHWDSIQRILGLPEQLIVYPGHEYRNRQPSSLKDQKLRNPNLTPRTKREYVDYLEGLKLGPAEWMKDVLKANYACAQDPKAAWIPVDVPACEVKGTMDIGANDQQVAGIPAEEVKRELDAGVRVLLLDVRDPRELTEELGHITGVINIPVTTLSHRLPELEKYRDQQIITVCKSGGRAHTAAQILMQAGFPKVHVMVGGMQGWKRAGYQSAR
ncbi:MAG: MBL-fold metallo-hydrolase superfamily [Nitrospira sp.]|jgi:glyoxylase-like metal-dependent hydrolase (beta-lactamase superfamily II)/rhodanese-related sulfurtransferase|nr:MAG: MBL-fold metallo-hydrolase superfamily [Nitrospira sp.]